MIQPQMRGWDDPAADEGLGDPAADEGLGEAGGQALVPSISHSLGTHCNLGPTVCFIASPSWQMLPLSLTPQSISVTHCSLFLEWSFPSYRRTPAYPPGSQTVSFSSKICLK